jgi:GNAT superfamily N-acetyltransferase
MNRLTSRSLTYGPARRNNCLVQVKASTEFRTELRAGDLGAVIALQGREYAEQYGLDYRFEAGVARSVAEFGLDVAEDPEAGRLWLAEDDDGLLGCIAMSREGDRHGRVRWFLVAQRARGQGLGRRLFAEAMSYARERFDSLELETFSELTTAAGMYRSVGFELRDTRPQNDWGREIQLQHYDLRF